MTFPLRSTVTVVFGFLIMLVIVVFITLDYIGSRDAILRNARMNIANAAETADKAVDGLMRRAALTVGTVAHLPKSIFDWRNPEPLLVTLAGSLKNAPEFYSIFVGLPDGAAIKVTNLARADGGRREIAGMPSNAATAWQVLGPTADGRDRPQRWWFFDGEGNAVPGVAGIDIANTDYDPRTRPCYLRAQATR